MTSSSSLIRTRWAAVGAAVAVTLGAVGLGGLNIASAEISSGDRPVFVPISPCRLVDTRPGANVGPKSGPLGPSEVLSVTAHGNNGECTGPSAIPTDAVGLSLNVTALGQTQRTFLTIWGEGADPGTSSLNPEPGQPPTPNAVNTPLSATGTFNIRNNAGSVNTLIDVVGYYAHHNHDDRYVGMDALGATIVVRGQMGSEGDLRFVGDLPAGITLVTERTSTGRYTIALDGLLRTGLDGGVDNPMTVLLTAGSLVSANCVQVGTITVGNPGAVTKVGVRISCADNSGAASDAFLNLLVLL